MCNNDKRDKESGVHVFIEKSCNFEFETKKRKYPINQIKKNIY